MEDLNTIYGSEAFDAVRGLEHDRALIEQALQADEFVSDVVRAGYEAAYAELGNRINELTAGTYLQNSFAAQGELTFREEEELSPLAEMLPAETMTSLKGVIEAKRAAVAQFFERYGASTEPAHNYYDKVTASAATVSASVDVIEVIETPATQLLPTAEVDTTREKEPKHVIVRFGDSQVRLGRAGRFIPYVNRRSPNERDYTDMRRKALLYLLVNEGQPLSPHQIWENISDEPFDRNAMSKVRSWLTEKLQYGHSPLILTNNTRGLASRYYTNPDFKFEMVFDQRLTAVAEGAEPTLTSDAQQIIEEKEKDPGADFGDLFIAAGRLASFNKVLAAHGIAEVTDEMCEQLGQHKPDWSELRNDSKAITSQRTAAIERVKALFMDEERLFDFLDKNEAAFNYAFVDFIANLEDSGRELLDRLFRAEKRCEDVVVRGQVVGQKFKVYDEHEDEVLPPDAGPDFWYKNFPGDKAPQPTPARRPVNRRPKPPVTAVAQPEPEPAPEPAPQPQPTPEPQPVREKNSRLAQLESCVDELLGHFISEGRSLSETYNANQLRHIVPNGMRSMFTRTQLIKVAGDNHTARNAIDTHRYDIKEILTIALSGNKKFASYIAKHRKDLDKYIEGRLSELATAS